MKFIFAGDVVGKGGRKTAVQLLPVIKAEYGAEFVILNGENSGSGIGLSASCVEELSRAADVITGGDHIWDVKGFDAEIDRFPNLIRPANLPASHPGRGWGLFQTASGIEYAVINAVGRVFMREGFPYPAFEVIDRILREEIPPRIKNIIVDFHAEASSEEQAMAAYLDGRVTAVLGTHTHVATADERIEPNGTAAISDVGMTGADRSILGRSVEDVLYKFTVGMPNRLTVIEKGRFRLDAVAVTFDETTGKASAIERIRRYMEI